MQGCYRLSDAGCEALVRRCAPSLQEFELSCNQRITKQSVDYFSELAQLHSLTLSECPQLDDAALSALLTMPRLRKLALNQMERLTDDFICELAKSLPDLEELSLARCSQLSNAAVQAILENCRSLRVVDLSDLHLLTDECFEPVRPWMHATDRSIECLLGEVAVLACWAPNPATAMRVGCGPDARVYQQLSRLFWFNTHSLTCCLFLVLSSRAKQIRAHGHPLRRVTIRGCLGFTDAAIAHLASGASEYLEVLEMSSVAVRTCVRGPRHHARPRNRDEPRYLLLLSINACADWTSAAIDVVGARAQEATDASLMVLKEFCARSLRELDISFCRKMAEDALGVLVDECEALSSLKLWGCTQVGTVGWFQSCSPDTR